MPRSLLCPIGIFFLAENEQHSKDKGQIVNWLLSGMQNLSFLAYCLVVLRRNEGISGVSCEQNALGKCWDCFRGEENSTWQYMFLHCQGVLHYRNFLPPVPQLVWGGSRSADSDYIWWAGKEGGRKNKTNCQIEKVEVLLWTGVRGRFPALLFHIC